jgi:hypothetical protein
MKKCHVPLKPRSKSGSRQAADHRTSSTMPAAMDNCYAFRDELPREPEAIEAPAGDLSQAALPVTEWRWSIYRVRIKPKNALCTERYAFVEAGSDRDARIRVAAAVAAVDSAALAGDGIDEALSLVAAKSYEDCLRDGVSLDPDRRLFELEWCDGTVTAWVHEPIFLLPQPSVLTLKWACVLACVVGIQIT